MVLMTWKRFWVHLMFMIEGEIISEEAVQKLFADWYRSWSPFVDEYLGLLKLAKKQFAASFGSDLDASIIKFERIHKLLSTQGDGMERDYQKRFDGVRPYLESYINMSSMGATQFSKKETS